MPRILFILSVFAILLAGCTSYNRNNEGLRYFGQARYDQALVSFQAALNAEPENPDSFYNIGATYHQSARLSLQMGQTAVAQQQYDEAEKYYRLCLSRDTNHTPAYRGLAVLYLDCQAPEAAFNLLAGWSRTNPVSVDPKIELARYYQEWAQVCMMQGRSSDAEDCLNKAVTQLQEALTADPNNFRALRAMGYLREQSGDVVNAIADYRRSLQSNPDQKDLSDRISALEAGAGYAPGASAGATGGATVYQPSSSNSTMTSALGRNPF